jgi:hypothetical protein
VEWLKVKTLNSNPSTAKKKKKKKQTKNISLTSDQLKFTTQGRAWASGFVFCFKYKSSLWCAARVDSQIRNAALHG